MRTFPAFAAGSLFLLAVPLFAANKPEAPVAEMQVTPGAIQWRLLVPSDSVTLTIAGPDGETFTRESKSQNVTVSLNELGGGDGTYIYQLSITPPTSGDYKEKVRKARETSDEKTARRLMREAGLDHPLAQSGAFTILNGSAVSPNLQEGTSRPRSAPGTSATSSGTDGRHSDGAAPSIMRLVPRPLDQVIPDDLIVQGSACVGIDCVDGESFGSDTIRLKANDTRIKFDDTSTTAGVPANDWQFTANDSSGGGANKLSIEDITGTKIPFTVIAGAPTNSMFIDSVGKVGFRTSTPVLDLHIMTSNTPGIRLDQNSGGGFTAQTWDVAGNEANFFVRDLTFGNRLPFRIRPGAPTSSIDISATGNVGIGTGSPAAKLTVFSDGSAVRIQQTDPASYAGFTWYEGTNQKFAINALGSASAQFGGPNAVQIWQVQNAPMIFLTDGTERLRITGAGNIGINNPAPSAPIEHSSGARLTAVGVWADASSRELKENICDIDSSEARAALQGLEPVKFFYKADREDQHAGFIAEDVPEIVATKDRKTLSSMDIVAVLTKVVQDQQKTIDQLSKRIEQLEKK